MNDFRHLYRETFSHVKASPALRKELLAMTEKTRKSKKFVLRKLLVAAAVLALAFALAMGANAATNGALFEFIGMTSIEVGGETIDANLYHGTSISGLDTYVITTKGDGEDAVEWEQADNSDTVKTYVEIDEGGKVIYTDENGTEVSSAPET